MFAGGRLVLLLRLLRLQEGVLMAGRRRRHTKACAAQLDCWQCCHWSRDWNALSISSWANSLSHSSAGACRAAGRTAPANQATRQFGQLRGFALRLGPCLADVAQQHWLVFRKLHDQVKLPAHRIDVPGQSRQAWVFSTLKTRNAELLHAEALGHRRPAVDSAPAATPAAPGDVWQFQKPCAGWQHAPSA